MNGGIGFAFLPFTENILLSPTAFPNSLSQQPFPAPTIPHNHFLSSPEEKHSPEKEYYPPFKGRGGSLSGRATIE